MVAESNVTPASSENGQPTCGIIMPISALDGCGESHWLDVRNILSDSIEDAGFTPHMVSDADDIGIIQKRIIQNLYSNPVAVCDVSGKNPNVMFELGMRLAFDKPTIIVKDDKTTYSFDTSPIEHLEYPRDLRFPQMVDFQEKLAEKIQGTYKKATTDKNYTTFLKHFGAFTVPVLETKEISKEDFILEELRSMKTLVSRLSTGLTLSADKQLSMDLRKGTKSLCLREWSDEQFANLLAKLSETTLLPNPQHFKKGKSHFHLNVTNLGQSDRQQILNIAKELNSNSRIIPRPRQEYDDVPG